MSKETESDILPQTGTPKNEEATASTGPDIPAPVEPVQSAPGNLHQLAHERRQFSVFQVDEFIFQPATTRSTHWSVPWSDLMMTLFILFLVMFVYQTSNKQLAVGDETEVIGGQTTSALEIAPANTASVPYVPIKPGLPLITAGTIKKIVPIHVYDLEPNIRLVQSEKGNPLERINKNAAGMSESEKKFSAMQSETEQASAFPNNQAETAARNTPPENPEALMNIIRATIARYNLDKYAAVDLDAESNVRITLGSDLFFTAGKADLGSNSMVSLQEIGETIKNTPFMIQVIGYTDNQPSTSERYPSNWEMSAARASSIARFLIEETEMNPNQFMVIGYSSYHPLYPNTSQQNRSANRRIEIIITKQRPQQIAANTSH